MAAIAESPPPPPRAFFGRNEFIEKIIDFAEHLIPIALIGAGGIGKTSIALTILHDDRIKRRFGDNRRFVRCDRFPASCNHFLSRLSKVIGASVKNPEDLTPLRPFLSSKKMLIVLDNAESILDPQGTDAQEIYAVVEELSQFSNVCLCVTSRISTIPPDCKRLDVPTLSVDAARNTFYHTNDGERSYLVDNVLEQLGFHPLSIALLATVAHHNKWDTRQLIREWERRRTSMLHTEHNRSLSATIELSLASPMFQELGPDARGLLEVVAFFPQGVDEANLDRLFPAISNRRNIFNKFCILSLAYRSDGFITMLAPLRDHLSPKDPKSSQLLCTTKEHYFSRLSVDLYPGKPGLEEARWITSEDVNVEHLLNIFMPIDVNSKDVWEACRCFMEHLYAHKPRLVVLGPKIEGLPDVHPSKPKCLSQLSWLFKSVGNHSEYKRLLTHALELWRERGDDAEVAQTLGSLADANRTLGLNAEGILQAKEATEIFERLNDISEQARSLHWLAWLLFRDNQLDAAEAAASRAIDLYSGEGDELEVCQCHRVLGHICHSKGKTMEAMNHLETALRTASSLNYHGIEFWVLSSLTELSYDQGRFDDANAYIERAKSHAVNDACNLGRAMQLQSRVWYKQRRFGEARSEALRAVGVFQELGAASDAEECRKILQRIEGELLV